MSSSSTVNPFEAVGSTQRTGSTGTMIAVVEELRKLLPNGDGGNSQDSASSSSKGAKRKGRKKNKSKNGPLQTSENKPEETGSVAILQNQSQTSSKKSSTNASNTKLPKQSKEQQEPGLEWRSRTSTSMQTSQPSTSVKKPSPQKHNATVLDNVKKAEISGKQDNSKYQNPRKYGPRSLLTRNPCTPQATQAQSPNFVQQPQLRQIYPGHIQATVVYNSNFVQQQHFQTSSPFNQYSQLPRAAIISNNTPRIHTPVLIHNGQQVQQLYIQNPNLVPFPSHQQPSPVVGQIQHPMQQQQDSRSRTGMGSSVQLTEQCMRILYSLLEDPLSENIKNSPVAKNFERLSLEDQMREIVRALSLTNQDTQQREAALRDLFAILRGDGSDNYFKECDIYPFGSYLTMLGDQTSDVDVYVDAFALNRGLSAPKNVTNLDVLEKTLRILRRAACPPNYNKAFCRRIIPIREARVPIIKINTFSNINIDLSFENLTSLRNSRMICLYMALNPIVRPLTILIRYWAKFHTLTGSNSIKNYCLNLLILVFLTNKKIIPPVYELQKLQMKEISEQTTMHPKLKDWGIIDGWDTRFSENTEQILKLFPSSLPFTDCNVISILRIAKEFFELYGTADLRNTAICSYTSEFMPRSAFKAGDEEDLPISLDRYKDWAVRQPVNRRLNTTTPFCVQDPFILSFNVGAVTPFHILLRFQVACNQTAEIINNGITSMLQLFKILPLEVGCRKFLSLQDKQRRTIQVKKEIETFVKTGVLDLPSEDIEDEETMGLHRLSINQIIDKNSIRFGKGFESLISFEPSQDFQNRFGKTMLKYNMVKTHSPRNLLEKMKILWMSILKDFLDVYWENIFHFEVSIEEKEAHRTFYGDRIFGEKRRKNYEHIFTEKTKRGKSKNKVEEEISPEQIELIEEKLNELGDITEKMYYAIVNCSSFVPVWKGREQILDRLIRQVPPIGESPEDSPVKVNQQSKGRRAKRAKKIASSVSIKINPLDLQTEVTKVILANSKNPLKNKLSFKVFIKIDSSFVDDIPIVYFIFDKNEETSKLLYEEGVSTIVENLLEVFPLYAMHRLIKWGDIFTETKSEAQQTDDLEVDFEDLLPPSESSSECGSPIGAIVESVDAENEDI